jgi:hypothetical protein
MNAASVKTSERLQRVDRLLSDGKARTTRDIIHGACVCAVNSIIAELRLNGREIICHREGDKFYYRRVI